MDDDDDILQDIKMGAAALAMRAVATLKGQAVARQRQAFQQRTAGEVAVTAWPRSAACSVGPLMWLALRQQQSLARPARREEVPQVMRVWVPPSERQLHPVNQAPASGS